MDGHLLLTYSERSLLYYSYEWCIRNCLHRNNCKLRSSSIIFPNAISHCTTASRCEGCSLDRTACFKTRISGSRSDGLQRFLSLLICTWREYWQGLKPRRQGSIPMSSGSPTMGSEYLARETGPTTLGWVGGWEVAIAREASQCRANHGSRLHVPALHCAHTGRRNVSNCKMFNKTIDERRSTTASDCAFEAGEMR